MSDVGLGFGFRVRVGGVAVDLGGFVNDIEGGEERKEGLSYWW